MNPTQPGKLIWLVLLAGFWALYGLAGRDAWQADEAENLGTLLSVLEGSVSLWATPAPLFNLVAVFLAWLSPLGLGVQDSARLASGFFMLTALLATSLAARRLLGPGFGAAAVLALLGGFGLMLRAHALMPETALVATWAVFFWGMGLARTQYRAGGLLLGLALAALSLGLRGLSDLLAALAILLLPLGFLAWRERVYRKTLKLAAGTGTLALLAGVGLIVQAGQWDPWWARHGVASLAFVVAPGKLFSELTWFAWPLWPLALAAIWHDHRRIGRSPAIQLPLVASLVLLLAAFMPAWSRMGGLLPLLVPLALLAALALEHLRRGAAQAFYWFGVMCFMFFALAFWVYFSALEWGAPAGLARHVAQLTPGYVAGSVAPGMVWLAAGATLAWLLAIPLFPRAQIRPVLVWATGMILTWTLLMSLFRPWLEAGWAYRPLVEDMARHLPADACVNAQVDPAMAAMLRYHLPEAYQPEGRLCAYRLDTVKRDRIQTAPHPGSTLVWQGFRPRDKNQVYRLHKDHGS
jgi:4-amino-4-deoxy-L-arabinose transferase-like glycosyltransferase